MFRTSLSLGHLIIVLHTRTHLWAIDHWTVLVLPHVVLFIVANTYQLHSLWITSFLSEFWFHYTTFESIVRGEFRSNISPLQSG